MRGLGVLLLAAALVMGAKPGTPEPACWWDPATLPEPGESTLTAVNLPDEYSITFWPGPTGVHAGPDTFVGTFSVSETRTAYVWQRGRGKSLIKAGPQLNDYHVVAMCTVTVQ